MPADAAVSLRGVSKRFDGEPVVDGIDFDVPEGSVTALLGPSGCGKTTLLRLIAGLESPDAGTVSLRGEIVAGPGVGVPPEARRVGLVFQNGALFPHLDVTRNVGYGLPKPERKGSPRVDEMLELVGLAGLGGRFPDTLSGGQAQRVALARALAPAPTVVLLDEPFSNLDAVLRSRLRREVADIVRAAGVTVVLVTHDRDEAFAVADRVAVMRDGVIVQSATPRELYRNPADAWVAAFVGDLSHWPEPGALRPEDLQLTVSGEAGARNGCVVREEYTGADVLTVVELDDGPEVVIRSRAGTAQRAAGAAVGVRPA